VLAWSVAMRRLFRVTRGICDSLRLGAGYAAKLGTAMQSAGPGSAFAAEVIELWPASSALARHGRGASEDMYNAGPFDRVRGSAASSIAQ
jgi:hypothetical protein